MAETEEQNEQEDEQEDVINVLSKKTGVGVRLKKTFGTSLMEATSLYGEEVVFKLFRRQAVIACQSLIRGVLDKGGSKNAAIEAGLKFTPGVVTRTRAAAKDPLDELAKQVVDGKITMQQLEEQLRARLTELGAV